MVENDVDAMWFLPSALNVKVEKFNKARVNGGSNYDSLNVWVMKVYKVYTSCIDDQIIIQQHSQRAGTDY